MKKKNLLFLMLLSFVFSINVSAKTIICDYNDYKVKFYPEQYNEGDYSKWYNIYDKNGNEQREQIGAFKPNDESECPKEISINRKKYSLIVLIKTVICDYGDYQVKFYPEKYNEGDHSKWYDIYDKNGNEQREQIGTFNPKDEKECPKEISVDRKKYLLISSSDDRKVNCGNITGIPKKIPQLTSLAITIIHVAIPVILVIMGSLDLFKGITAQKEDEIKKGQQIFIKRLILAALIFFVVVIVKLLISVVANSSNDDISNCIDCFISNDCN